MEPCKMKHPLNVSAWFVLIGLFFAAPVLGDKNPPPPDPEENAAELVEAPQKPRKCRIVVTLHLRSGKQEESVFYTDAKDKPKCEKQANVHKTNFTPQLVKKKSVRVEWNFPN